MRREKIGRGYQRSGQGRGFISSPVIWLIDGKAYAKHKEGSSLMFQPLSGALEGYVPVNRCCSSNPRNSIFYEVGSWGAHIPFQQQITA